MLQSSAQSREDREGLIAEDKVHVDGDTVRRVMGRHSNSVHTLLVHLSGAGFGNAPRFLGIDDSGREVLSYIAGRAGDYPMQAPVQSLAAMDSALAILRRLHDLTTGFLMPDGHARHSVPGASGEVICHWDAAPYNFVFDGTRAAGLIDFDEAGPGRRIDDLAYFAYRFAPLTSTENLYDGGWPAGIDRFGRLARIFELYPDPRAEQLPDLIVDRLGAMRNAITARRPSMDPPDAAEADRHLEIYRRDQQYIEDQREEILNAVRTRFQGR
ncbi:phosphotransferase [Rhodococcoides yunnanense]|uniref:phosphotransferase n=1 Tax=Rhodococcoides yunnanense TaxID=278209 RepID=UPI001474A668|nr:phosphotransferase [Rhodococcus yunnanensis]